MGYKAAVQILKQAEDVKAKVLRKCDLLNDNETWTDQQKLQTIYHQAIVLDLEYALDKKVELDLWNIGFKNHITKLQELSRDKKNPRRSDYQALLTWFLEAASGFYLTLLQELCNSFDIDLPFRKRGNVFGQATSYSDQVNMPQTSSTTYICQYCLVHLGDIARYRNQRKQAESFYKQAILVSPTSGHPYNQLALLEASQGNKLSTVFYYIRGISVKNPFPASTTNLSNTLNSAIDKDSSSEKIPAKMTSSEFIQLFLCTHGYLHSATELKQADLAVKSLNSIMTALVATQSFTKDKLIKITTINLYALKHVMGQNDLKTTNDLTEDEKVVRELVLELIAGSLSAMLVPVHTLKMDETLLDYYALPAVKFLLHFIQNEPDVLKERVFSNRLQIWPSFCKFLNNTQIFLKDFEYDKYKNVPLAEDKALQGFLPVSKIFKDFEFKQKVDSLRLENLIRVKRIFEMGMWLTDVDVNGSTLMNRKNVSGEITFEPGSIQPDPTNELLEEMKSFTIVEIQDIIIKKSPDKKAGILKPQGSLEKSREERELFSSDSSVLSGSNSGSSIGSSNSEGIKIKRPKQNIALQSIFKKMEENKQVKFSVDEVDREKDKSLKFEKPIQKSQSNPNQQFNLPNRTQSFNQNHPAFPKTQNQDYLSNLRNMPNVQSEKDSLFPYNKNEMSGIPSNMTPQIMPPQYQNLQQHPQSSIFNANVKNSKPPPQSSYPPSGMSSQTPFNNPQMSVPYQNVSFPSSHPFNAWKREELPPQPNTNWWPQSSNAQMNQNYQRQDMFPMNYPYSANSFMQPNNVMPNSDFNKPTTVQSSSGDMFNSPWNNFSRNSYENGGQGMSMRQAMLKETNNISGSHMGRMSNAPENYIQNNVSAPGYSLFNTNSWTPNLAGQLRNNKPHTDNPANHLPQQSLFGGHGPQSLAQLLEQQNQLQKK